MKDAANEEAVARIAQLETELQQARAELERARGAHPDRAVAHLRRLEEENTKLREERRRLEETLTELRTTFRHVASRRNAGDPVVLIEQAVRALMGLFFGRRERGGD